MNKRKVNYERENRMVRVYRHRDKKANMSVCDFDDIWLRDNITSRQCSYCESIEKVGCDRKNNKKGHTKDNVIPCCKRCNLIKNRFFSPEDFKKIIDFCNINNIKIL